MLDYRVASGEDVNSLKSYVNSLRTEVVVDVAYVSDSNHNNPSRRDLRVGEIIAKSEREAGKTEVVDLIYKPITENLKNYPFPGEYVLVIRSSVGNFYLSSLNINSSSNNNIVKNKTNQYTKYNDDEFNTPSVIKKYENKTSALDKIDSPFFKTKIVPRRQLNYGDVALEGKFGNIIHLSYSPNSNPMLHIDNLNTSILMFNDEGGYDRITDTTYNAVVENELNTKKTGEHLIANSDRIILNSQKNGIFLQSKGSSVGVVSDKDIDISAGRQLSINGNIILIGTDANSEPLIRGREFGRQWVVLIQLLHEVAISMKAQNDVPFLKGIGSLIENKLKNGIAGEGVNNIKKQSVTKLLSEEVYIR